MALIFSKVTIPRPITAYTCRAVGNKFYMLGASGFEVYDSISGQTELELYGIPFSINPYTNQLIDNKIYIPDHQTDKLVIYDTTTKTSAVKTLPSSNGRYTSQNIDGKLYMPSASTNTLEIYDPVADLTVVKTLPNTMNRFASEVIDGKLYMPSGLKLEIYDPIADSTVTKTLPESLSLRTTSRIDGKLYMPETGGTRLQIYDPIADSSVTKTLRAVMTRFTSQAIEDILYLPEASGFRLGTYDSTLDESIDLEFFEDSLFRWASDKIDKSIYISANFSNIMEIITVRYFAASFSGNGSNVGTPPVNIELLEETTLTFPAPGTMARTGYDFVAWNTELDGSGTSYDPGDTFTMPEADVRFYAQWAIKTYTVTYNPNGADGGSIPIGGAFPYLASVEIAPPGNLTRTKCRFTGWNDFPNGVGQNYPVYGIFSMPAKNIILYAQWAISETTVQQVSRGSQYSGDLAVIDGDLVKRGGDYQRVYALDNMIALLVGTDEGYWGNLIEPAESQIPGGMEKLDGIAITTGTLKRNNAAVEYALSPMITAKIAKSISVESFNTENDRIDWEATIVLTDNSIYYYSTNRER